MKFSGSDISKLYLSHSIHLPQSRDPKSNILKCVEHSFAPPYASGSPRCTKRHAVTLTGSTLMRDTWRVAAGMCSRIFMHFPPLPLKSNTSVFSNNGYTLHMFTPWPAPLHFKYRTDFVRLQLLRVWDPPNHSRTKVEGYPKYGRSLAQGAQLIKLLTANWPSHFQEYQKLSDLNKKQSTVLVVGAGFIGVEWATWAWKGWQLVCTLGVSMCGSSWEYLYL